MSEIQDAMSELERNWRSYWLFEKCKLNRLIWFSKLNESFLSLAARVSIALVVFVLAGWLAADGGGALSVPAWLATRAVIAEAAAAAG